MSFHEKNITVTLLSFTAILIIYVTRIWSLIQNDSFTATNVFWLWAIVIVMSVIITIIAMILTHVGSTIYQVIQTGDKNPKINDVADERDKLIDLRGTKVTHTISSVGSFLAMLTFAFGQPPLVMFTLLIFFGVVAQIVGDISRLLLYRRGF